MLISIRLWLRVRTCGPTETLKFHNKIARHAKGTTPYPSKMEKWMNGLHHQPCFLVEATNPTARASKTRWVNGLHQQPGLPAGAKLAGVFERA